MRKSAAEKIVQLSDGPGSIHLFEIPEYRAAYKKCRAYLNRLQKEKIKRLHNRLKKEGKWEEYRAGVIKIAEDIEKELKEKYTHD